VKAANVAGVVRCGRLVIVFVSPALESTHMLSRPGYLRAFESTQIDSVCVSRIWLLGFNIPTNFLSINLNWPRNILRNCENWIDAIPKSRLALGSLLCNLTIARLGDHIMRK